MVRSAATPRVSNHGHGKCGRDSTQPENALPENALTVSDVGSAAISRQCGIEVVDQGGSGEGLGQKANRSGLQRPGADALIGEGRYENERRTVAPGTHEDEQVQTA